MRFRAAHKLTCYLMVAAALTTLTASASLGAGQIFGFVAAALLSWLVEPQSTSSRWIVKFDVPLKLLVLAFFCFTIFNLVKSFPEPDLTALLDLVLVLLAYKLLQRRSNRDYLQIYILSFLLILAASWLAQSAFFAVGFAAYVVTLTWSLILFHLRREIEDNYLVKHEAASAAQRVTAARVLDSRRVVGTSFFCMTAVASLGVIFGSALVFALAPRIGIGFLTGGIRRRTALVGFSDQVQLGHHGVLSMDNQTVVLRVELERLTKERSASRRDETISGMYWRGTVYDTYGKGQWLRARAPLTKTPIATSVNHDGARWTLISPPETALPEPSREELLKQAERQEIQLLALTHPVAFALDRAVAFEVPQPSNGSFLSTLVEPQHSGEASLRSARISPSGSVMPLADFPGARYVAYSVDSLRSIRPAQARTMQELPQDFWRPYLQVPPELIQRLGGLAKRITSKASTPAGKAQAIVEWLHKNKKYSVDLHRDLRFEDPLEDFLFAQPGGHCEYFATASAIMMRLVGIPTRYVNGFLGGEWNELANHVTVRDNRAHSWIEAYFSGFGWTRMDATPALSRSTRMSRMKQLLDSIELWWGQWVIEYDASRQLQLARGLAESLGVKRQRAASITWPSVKRVHVIAAVSLALLTFMTVNLVRRRRHPLKKSVSGTATTGPTHKLYLRALGRLASLKLFRTAQETPREFLERVKRHDPAVAEPFSIITSGYEQVRFGDRDLAPAQVHAMETELRHLEEACRAATGARLPTADRAA